MFNYSLVIGWKKVGTHIDFSKRKLIDFWCLMEKIKHFLNISANHFLADMLHMKIDRCN